MLAGRNQEGTAKAQLALATADGMFDQCRFEQVVIDRTHPFDTLVLKFEIGVNSGLRHGGISPLLAGQARWSSPL